MSSSLKKVFVSFSHFFTGGTLSILLGFVSFPILTRVLTREEYGIVGLVTNTMFLLVALAKAGLSDGIIRFYKGYSESPDKLLQFTSTIIFRGFLFSVITVLLYLVFFPEISRYLKLNQNYLSCFMIMGGVLLIRPLNVVVLNVLRASGKTFFFNAINLTGRTISIALSLFMLLFLIKKFYGYFIGLILSELVISSILFYWFFSNYSVSLSKVSGSLALKLIKFGIPLLFTELSYLLLSYADRYMIVAYKGESLLGLYSVGHNLASYISDILMFSISYAVIPVYVEIFEKEGRAKTEEFLEKCLHYLLIVMIPIFVGFSAVSKDLLITLASDKYADGASFSPIILLATFFLGLNSILNAGLYLEKKSRIIFLIMVSAVIINIILNMFFIPKYGLIGAAMATLIAGIWTSVLTAILSFKYITIRLNFKNMIYYMISSWIMYFIISQIHTQKVWSDLMSKIVIGILLFIPVVLLREKEIFSNIKSLLSLKAFGGRVS